MIYTRFGTPVNIISAREVTVWIETVRGTCKWHYKPVTKSKGRVEAVPVWHVVAKSAEDGRPICSGGEFCTNDLRADGGIKEIFDTCREVRERALAKSERDLKEVSAFLGL